MAKEALGIDGVDPMQGLGDGREEVLVGSGLGLAQEGFDFGPHHFDGIEIGAVGGQEEELGTAGWAIPQKKTVIRRLCLSDWRAKSEVDSRSDLPHRHAIQLTPRFRDRPSSFFGLARSDPIWRSRRLHTCV